MRERVGRSAGLVGALVGLALASCGPDHGSAFPQKLAEAERAETAGRYEEASDRYEDAAAKAQIPRDRAHARYLAGVMLLRARKLREGIAKLEPIARATPPVLHTADAAHQIALSRIGYASEEDECFRQLEQIVVRFPDSGVARPSLRQIVARRDAGPGGPASSLEYLRGLDASLLGSTGLGELLHYEIAEHLAAVGQTAQARDAFLATAKRWPYPHGTLWDDALFRASELDEQIGELGAAVAHLELLLGERESTYLVGSYQRPKMTRALFREGVLYAGKLHDHARARATFRRLYTDFTTSRLRDDALWFEAQLFKEDGDAAGACGRLEVLAREFPDSRYVPCAVDEAALTCSGRIQRPDRSQAPRSCHAYLLESRPRAQRLANPTGEPYERGLRRRVEKTPSQEARTSPALLVFLVFLFFCLFLGVVVFEVFVEFLVLFEALGFLFLVLRGGGGALLELQIDANVAELRVEELEELISVVARPFVEEVGEELEEVAVVEPTLDLLRPALR